MDLSDIILFMAIFFMTPLIILIFALEDGPYVYEKGVGFRKRTPKERQNHWINLGLTLFLSWVGVLVVCFLLEVFS
jgi:hypothetical protein